MKDENVHLFDESRTSTSLLRGAKAGEEVAWRNLVNVYSGRMFRWAKKAGMSDADAADLLQATFAKVFRALPEFRRDREGDTFGGWLRRIATHAIIDARRKTRRDATRQPEGGTDHQRRLQECPEELEPEFSTQILPVQDARTRAVIATQAEASAQHWQVFVQVTVEGRDPRDVATEFGLSRATVYTIKHRLTQRIRKLHETYLTEQGEN